jgi:beta-fructofuranosidase
VSVSEAFGARAPVAFSATASCVSVHGDTVTIEAPHAFGSVLAADLPERCRITMTIIFSENTDAFGLLLRAAGEGDSGYIIRFEVPRNRLVLDAWPRPGDVPMMVELERPLGLVPGTPLALEVLLDRTVCEVYAGGTVAMSGRLYPLPASPLEHVVTEEGAHTAEFAGPEALVGNAWGLFASEGVATFGEIAVFAP